MNEAVFLDSGIFIAFLNRKDQWHDHARTLFAVPPPRWLCSYFIASETYSWFLHRMGEEAARDFRALLDSLNGLKMMEATAHHHQGVIRMLDRFRGSKLTYVDASSLCFLERHKIRRVWSTDHHLALTGAEIFPRS